MPDPIKENFWYSQNYEQSGRSTRSEPSTNGQEPTTNQNANKNQSKSVDEQSSQRQLNQTSNNDNISNVFQTSLQPIANSRSPSSEQVLVSNNIEDYSSVHKTWAGCGARESNDASPKQKNTPETPKPESPQTKETETKSSDKENQSIKSPYPELTSKQEQGYKVKDDSPEALKAALKAGGTDLNDTMTNLSLTKDIISELSWQDQMRIMSNPMKINETLAEILKETNPETDQSKALSVIDKIYLNDPVKGAAISLFIADGSNNRDKKVLESLAASLYDSATSKVTTARELSDYKSNIKAGEKYYQETIRVPEAKRSQSQIEFLKMYEAYKNLPAHYNQTQVSMDFIQDAINFYTMPELTDGTF
jgi:hypothetical protein